MSIAKPEFKDSADLDNVFPASQRIYIQGKLHSDVRVPLREIAVTDGDPVRVYDTRGAWGDPAVHCDVRQGLPAIRQEWVVNRGDTLEIEGRAVRPEDNGYLSFRHASIASEGDGRTRLESFPGLRRKPRRSADGKPVTQMHYARKGIITPEMEYIAIRENLGREKA